MDVFDLFAKLTLDTSGYEKGLDGAKKLAGDVFKGIGVAIGGATTAVTGLVTASTQAYAEYEQLVGGVETLFGESADQIKKYAEAAYQTAGMTANEYMETSIQSAASLINSLQGDQAKAAELMDMSITDMSDNVNKMGTTMEAVQNAYRGFSRGNFTMLDNLALGFAGTKEGMEELLQKAEEFSGVKYDISSYADIVQAIHVVQQEMGITGTTAKEASETISGSFASMAAAWQNLVTGFARDNADIDGLINALVSNAEAAFGNILPIAEKALSGIGDFVNKIAPVIGEKLPELLNSVIPTLIESGVSFLTALLTGINDNLPMLIEGALTVIDTLVTGILENLPLVIDLGLQLLLGLAEGLAAALPELIPTIVEVILQIVETLIDNIDKLVDAAIAIILGLADGLIKAVPKLLEKAPVIVQKLITALMDNAPKMIDAAIELITMLTNFLTDPDIMDMLIQAQIDIVLAIVEALIENAPMLIDGAIQIMSALAAGLIQYVGLLIEKTPEIISKFVDSLQDRDIIDDLHDMGWDIIDKVAKGIADTIMIAKDWGEDLIGNFIDGIKGKWEDLKKNVSDTADIVKQFLGFSEPEAGPLSNFHTYAPDMMKLFAQGITDNTDLITDAISDSFDLRDAIGGLNAQAELSLAAANATSRSNAQKSLPIVLNIDGKTIAKVLYPYNEAENTRVGSNVAKGVALV